MLFDIRHLYSVQIQGEGAGYAQKSDKYCGLQPRHSKLSSLSIDAQMGNGRQRSFNLYGPENRVATIYGYIKPDLGPSRLRR